MFKLFRATVLALLVALCIFCPAKAQTWKSNPVSTAWNDPANWAEGAVPTATSNVVVNSCTVCPALSSDITLSSFTVNAGGGIDLQSFSLISTTSSFSYATVTTTAGKIIAGHISTLSNCLFKAPAGVAGAVTLEKNGDNWSVWAGGNTFNVRVTLNMKSPNIYAGYLRTSSHAPDVFNEEVAINNVTGAGIALAHNCCGAPTWGPVVFNKKLTVGGAGVTHLTVDCRGDVELTVNGSSINVDNCKFKQAVALNLY